jgi:hypothetical protein
MMKFKVWDKREKTWRKDVMIDPNGKVWVMNDDGDYVCDDNHDWLVICWGIEIDGEWYFEGDLATAIWYDSDEPALKLTGEIIFSEGWKCFRIWDGGSKTISELNAAGHEDWALEKYGNKWDNPELLGGRNEQRD